MLSRETLEGKRVLVTGGGSGLGAAMAATFAALSAEVFICGRDEAKLVQTCGEIQARGGRCKFYVVDVRDYSAVGVMCEKIASEGAPIDTLVNNAAGNFYCASEDLTPNGFRTIVDIVLHGTFNCTQQVGKLLINGKKPGVILNIVTTYTERGSAFVLPSACAKAGVAALTTSLAWEWAEYGIRVNAIAPGPFPTPGAWQRLVPDPRIEKIFLEQQPSGRFGKPEELATLAAFLVSDMAGYINGEVIAIDGGERLRGGQFNFLTQLMPREKLKETFAKARARPS